MDEAHTRTGKFDCRASPPKKQERNRHGLLLTLKERENCVMNISASEAFLMFGKWRDGKSPVQLSIRKADGSEQGSPVSIISTSEIDESVDAEIVANTQKQSCRLDLRGASFSYGEPAHSALYPEFAEGKWTSYLVVECPTGTMFLSAERFPWSGG